MKEAVVLSGVPVPRIATLDSPGDVASFRVLLEVPAFLGGRGWLDGEVGDELVTFRRTDEVAANGMAVFRPDPPWLPSEDQG